MNVKTVAKTQYARIVDRAANQLVDLQIPAEGWLMSLRKALGMSGAQVAKRLGVTRSAVHQAERAEIAGAITIKQMEKMAKAMGGKFVYAIVPDGSVAKVIHTQARQKALARIKRASGHMALEDQVLSQVQLQQKVDDMTDDLIRDMPSDFWEMR